MVGQRTPRTTLVPDRGNAEMGERVDGPRIEAAVRELLLAVGLDPETPELLNTPLRVADAYAEFFSGVGEDAAGYLKDAVPVGDQAGELVLVRDIELRSMCEHHLLPFRGRAHVAYRPSSQVVGLSALPKVVRSLAARPQVQERLGEQIAHTIDDALAPQGVLVVLEASHGCVTDRGVREQDAIAVTVAARGDLADAAEQAALFALMRGRDDSQ